jgi:hypothetical protein
LLPFDEVLEVVDVVVDELAVPQLGALVGRQRRPVLDHQRTARDPGARVGGDPGGTVEREQRRQPTRGGAEDLVDGLAPLDPADQLVAVVAVDSGVDAFTVSRGDRRLNPLIEGSAGGGDD